MCVSYRSRYNTLSNICFPSAPKHLQEIFWLVSRLKVIKSPERVSNRVGLDPFTSDKNKMESEMKGLNLIRLTYT